MIKTKDPILLELCHVPFREIHGALDSLRKLRNNFLSASDQRGSFLTAYCHTTHELVNWIDKDLFFDSEFMKEYLLTFSNYYREALYHYESGDFDKVPSAWKIAFDTCRSQESSGILNLILGINAHINHDLPLTIREVGVDRRSLAHINDHEKVNKALLNVTPRIRDAIISQYHQKLKLQNRITGFQMDQYVIAIFRDIRKLAWDRGTSNELNQKELDQYSKTQARNILKQRYCLSQLAALKMNHYWNWVNYIPKVSSLKASYADRS